VGVACLFAEPWRLFRTRVFGLDFAPQSVVEEPPIPPVASPRKPFGAKLLGYFNSFPLTVILGLFLLDNLIAGLALEATLGMGAWGRTTTASDGATALSSPRVHVDSSISYPWDTGLVIALWAWCAVRLLMGSERRDEPNKSPVAAATE